MVKEKVPDGEMTTAELRKLVKAQNLLIKKELIIIPVRSKRDGVIKAITDAGYKINHKKKQLEIDKVIRKRNVDMKKAKKLIPVISEEQKKKNKEKREATKMKKEQEKKKEKERDLKLIKAGAKIQRAIQKKKAEKKVEKEWY